MWLSELKRLFRRRDSGQTIIFFAILLSGLFATAGIAIEGGRVFVEYRRAQAAADMAALIGAQALPCNTTDTSCITNAETLACTYATNNGLTGCTAGGASAPSANVPPVACSPYDFMDYGNGSGNANCKSTFAPSYYSYIEVRLTDNLGNIPIFNIPVTLAAHAVAKRGPMTPGDFTMMTLDPSKPLNAQGDASLVVTGSVFGAGGITGNNKINVTCQGGWYSPPGTTITGTSSDTTGSPVFSPPGCTGSNDATTDAQTLPPQADPYAGGSAPPTQPAGTSFPNCPECSQSGYWVDLGNNAWHHDGDGSDPGKAIGDVELFPGIYTTPLVLGNSQGAYFNPGVYTFVNGMSLNHGNMCVYGAPDCMDGGPGPVSSSTPGFCATDQFSTGTSQANQWYYSCSPYGFFDTNPPAGGPLLTTPTFTDGTTPLNGVTFYLPANSTGIQVHGNGGKNGDVYLAAPNPCPGTGESGPEWVAMPAGSATAGYTYTNTYRGGNDGMPWSVSESTAGTVYPSYDFSLPAECGSSNLVWPGEMIKPQHLHFLFYIQGPGSDVNMNGASGQQFTGIWYAPSSIVTIQGAGKGGGGPPWIDGQMIMYDATLTGNSYNDVVYRPCGPGPNSCGSGLGTQLVQ
jgi:Flp pilus assembly protein TadG